MRPMAVLSRILLVALIGAAASTTTASAAFVLPDPPDGAVIQAGANGYADPTFTAYWDAGSDGSVGSRYGTPWLFFSQYPNLENGKFPTRNWLTLGSTIEAPGATPDIWTGTASGAYLLTPGTYFWQMEVSTYASYQLIPPGCCDYVQSPVWSFTVVPDPAPPTSAPTAAPTPVSARPATPVAPSCGTQQASVRAAQGRVAAAKARMRKARGSSAVQRAKVALTRSLRARANANSALWKCQGLIK